MSGIHYYKGSPTNYAWEGITPKAYTGKEGILKHVLIGLADESNNFLIRYFSLQPGCSSNLERHAQEHGVVIMHGKGKVQLNEEFFEVGPMDAVFVSPNDLHQFTNIGNDPFGFICVVTAKP